MKTTIFLIRHGQTDWNVEDRVQGHTNESELTEIGKKQALLLKKDLSKFGFDVIYSSPLKRALNTARIVFPDDEIITDDRLIERYYGTLVGMTRDEIWKKYPEVQKEREKIGTTPDFADVEKMEDLKKRGMDVLDNITKKNEGKTIAIVAHGAIIAAIMTGLHKLPAIQKGKFKPKSCGYSVIEYENGKFTVKVLNHTEHLNDIDK